MTIVRVIVVSVLVSMRVASAEPQRPAVQVNRAAEDWSALADPALRTEPLDSLKYIPLWGDDPKTYLSVGLTLRERLESTGVALFGVKSRASDVHDLQRLQVHADLHLDPHWNLFLQLEDVRAFGKEEIGPADENPLDVRQAFVMYQHELGAGTFKLRVGRQEFSFDLQRFISLRDGPNVQQAFDGVWAAWDVAPWKVLGFVSLPVEYAHDHVLDDTESIGDRLSMLRLERSFGGAVRASTYYLLVEKPSATYGDASGEERRHVFDTRFVGGGRGWDWDAEAMVQLGHVGDARVRAWATGARAGYSTGHAHATRFGVQVDTASGDRHPRDGTIETFSPLIPNGYYFTLASETGYSNLIHVKPSVTQRLTNRWVVTAACGLQWRETTNDAIYLHPMTALPNTAGVPGRWTGSYGQLRSDMKVGPDLSLGVELVRFQAGRTIREAGGTNSNYAGVEARLSW